MSTTAVTNVRIFNGEYLTEPTTIMFENGLILEKTTGAADNIIDGSGCTMLPGLIDSHIHLDDINNLKEAARYGVTTMLDMTTVSPELIDSLRNQPGLSDVRSCYFAACAPDCALIEAMGYPESTIVYNADDAERLVNEQVDLGADYIKIILDNPMKAKNVLSPETIVALVSAAHKNNKLVFAHATTPGDFKTAIEAGVDVLNHMPLVGMLSPAIVDTIVAKGVLVIPTMVMMKGMAESLHKIMPGASVDYQNVEFLVNILHKAGAMIIAGTDANRTNDLCHIAHGSSLHQELELLVVAGMTPVQALQSATCVPAEAFSFNNRGVIAADRRADLLLVAGDPTVDISATQAIKGVWINGVQVDL